MVSHVTCLVTIHGVGFQQPPEDGVPGYADDLHRFLLHIEDKLIHNVPNSPPGALQAHDYWDNTAEFTPKVAELLRDVLADDNPEVG